MGVSREVVEKLYAAFTAGDVDTALSLMSPDIVWNEAENHPLADRNPYTTPHDVAAGVFARVGADWTEFLVTVRHIVEAEPNVVVEARYTGISTRTGKPLDAQTVHIFRVDEQGRIASFQQYTDTLQFALVRGALE